MMRLAFILLMCVAVRATFAQAPPTAAPFLRFSDAREEQSYNNLVGSPVISDVVTLLTLTDIDRKHSSVEAVTDRLEQFVYDHRKLKAHSLTEKQLRQLFNEVQSAFLVRYDARALFADLFTNGDFNCVTASALFALILNELAIPYTVHLTPDHMYLATLVQGSPAVIETTDPVRGVFIITPRTRKKYVDELLRAKRISKGQLDSLGMDGALATLTSNDTVIDLRATVGTHYHNSGVFISDQDLPKGIGQLAKAYGLHPSEHTKDLLQMALLKRVGGLSYDSIEDVQFLLDTYSFINLPTMERLIPGDHARLLDKFLIQRSDTGFTNAMLTAFLGTLRTEEARDRIRFQHHAEMGRYLALKNQWDMALEHLLIANSLEPEHAQVGSLVIEALVNRLERLPDRSSYIQHLDDLVAQHPQLRETSGMLRCYQVVHLIAAEDHFNIDERRKAEEFLKRFEELYKELEDLPVDGVARAYIAGWRSWTRARDSEKARSYITRGLGIAPFNEDLRRASRYNTY
ncbi:MAG: hypothetical protein WEC15_02055 [Flavobacteriales bacterium]